MADALDLNTATVKQAHEHLRELASALTEANTDATLAEFQRVVSDERFEAVVTEMDVLLSAAAVVAEDEATESGYRRRFFPLMEKTANAYDFHSGPMVYEQFELNRSTVERIIAGITPENEFFTEIPGWVFRISTKGYHAQLVEAGDYPIYATRLSDSTGFFGHFDSNKGEARVTFNGSANASHLPSD